MTAVAGQILDSFGPLPVALHTCADAQQLDRRASAEGGPSASVLMSRAGKTAFRALRQQWPEAASITVLCGGGNNAGDGYVVAALAAQNKLCVRALWLSSPERLEGAAQQAYQYAQQEGVLIVPFEKAELDDPSFSAGVFVDALLGIGVQGEVRAPYADAIHWLNRQNGPVVALDLPSGLCGDSGAELGVAVRAELTVTFIGCKRGLLTGRGPALTGQLLFDDLGVPQNLLDSVPARVQRCNLPELLSALPQRAADAHKGQFGHVLVVGGDKGLGGAAAMAAEMAVRAGAGLVSVATQADHIAPILARLPEAMAVAVASGQELEPYLARPGVLAVGPGLGRSPWSEQMLQQSVKTGLPMVVDADGLNLLAEGRVVPKAQRANWILTPHPGEAARLLGGTIEQIQTDRFAAVVALQQRFGGVVVLKGAGSLICDGDSIWLANVGNAGMATGGMGDILTGLIGALLAQGLSPSVAAQLGVCLHGTAGDMAAEDRGQLGMLPTDLIAYVRELLNS